MTEQIFKKRYASLAVLFSLISQKTGTEPMPAS